MGNRLNRLDEPVFMALPKPMQTEFGIHPGLESCVGESVHYGVIRGTFNQNLVSFFL